MDFDCATVRQPRYNGAVTVISDIIEYSVQFLREDVVFRNAAAVALWQRVGMAMFGLSKLRFLLCDGRQGPECVRRSRGARSAVRIGCSKDNDLTELHMSTGFISIWCDKPLQ